MLLNSFVTLGSLFNCCLCLPIWSMRNCLLIWMITEFSWEGKTAYDRWDFLSLFSLLSLLRARPTLKILDQTSEWNQFALDLTQSNFKYLQWWFLNLPWFFTNNLFSPITDVNSLHCSLHPFSYPDTVENHLSLSPLHTPIRQQSGLLPISPSPCWTIPALTAFFCPFCAPALTNLYLSAGLQPVPQPLSLLRSPKLGTVLQLQPLQCQTMGKDCCPQQYPSGEQSSAGLWVLVTTWWSCQDIFRTVQSLKLTAEIVRQYLCKKEWQLVLFNPTQKIYLAKLSKFELYLTESSCREMSETF